MRRPYIVGLVLGLSTATVPAAAAPAVEVDRPAAPARRVNTIHLLVRADAEPTQVDFERASIVRRVEVINAPSTLRGEVTRVEAADSRLAKPDPLLLRLTVSAGSVGRFYLGTIRLRVDGSAGVRVFEDAVYVELFADPAYADEELRGDLLAAATGIVDGRRNFARPMHAPRSRQLLERCLARRPFALVLDPGHDPAGDRGARSHRDADEVDFNDRMAGRIREALAGISGLGVALSRDPEVTLPLAERVRAIRDLAPDLVFSIHHDSVRRSRQTQHRRRGRIVRGYDDRRGFSIYVPMVGAHASPAYQAARYVASGLLAADRPIGRFFEWGEPRYGIYNGDLLYLIDHLTVPTVLLEVGFLCHPAEEKMLNDRRFIDRHSRLLADALLRHIYFSHCEGVRLTSPWIPDAKSGGAGIGAGAAGTTP